MNSSECIITFGSWEDRFRLGFREIVAGTQPNQSLLYYFEESSALTEQNRADARKKCDEAQIECVERKLSVVSPAANWQTIRDDLRSRIGPGKRVTVDLTTMPREIIWSVFWMLDLLECSIHYTYFRPRGYGDWLSREPQRPRLIYKLSGITRLKARTALVILAGYDLDRTKQLIDFFEPEITLLGLQVFDKDPKNDDKMRKQQAQAERCARDRRVECFPVDAYASDCGQEVVRPRITPYLESHNLILSSLGPKLSAVSLYRLHRAHRTTALAYAPSQEFNLDYSHGIGDGVFGSL